MLFLGFLKYVLFLLGKKKKSHCLQINVICNHWVQDRLSTSAPWQHMELHVSREGHISQSCKLHLGEESNDTRDTSTLLVGMSNRCSHSRTIWRFLKNQSYHTILQSHSMAYIRQNYNNSKRYVHSHGHCSTIYKSQDMEAT